jgi:NAD-reducing hydrogenase small subunit
MSKLKLATVWLDGCSGCHMSFLDMDESLLELAELVDVV